MQLVTFNEVLTTLCDEFDELISPKSISRTNTNIIYLLLKAFAKGFELINNICAVVSYKFDPANCSDEDLSSVAYIVGTERLKGSASGLHILVHNTTTSDKTLLTGTYSYALDDDTTFTFDVTEDKVIEAENYIDVIAMSEEIGSFPVTAQSSITITSEQTIPDGITFSCTDNTSLLGIEEETDLAFRQRVLTTTDRQNSIVELQTAIRNLPYIFDCKIKFNDSLDSIVYDGYTIPSYTMLICYSGSARNEIAETVAKYSIFPTVNTEDSVPVYYENEVFNGGRYTVYITPFKKTLFSVNVIYKINNVYISDYDAKQTIRKALMNTYVSEVHQDYIKEDEVYNIIEDLDISGIEVLGVNLSVNGQDVNYVQVPVSRIAELEDVLFTKVD